MAISIESISTERAKKRPRIVLVGTEKVGKSSFAGQFPNPIFLPIKGEEGIDDVPGAAFPTLTTFEEVIEALGVLHASDHEFQTVVIDSVSTLEQLIFDRVCRDGEVENIEAFGGGFGKGYTAALSYWRMFLDWLDAIRNQRGIGCVCIGHTKVKTVKDPLVESYDGWVIDLNDKAANMLARWADCTLFANRRTHVKKDKAGFGKDEKTAISDDQRFLYTQKRANHPGGGRGVYGHLPYELKLEYSAFESAIQAAN